MIQANKLRIGNLIYGLSDRINEVTGYARGKVYTTKVGLNFETSPDELSGIPLTPEILEKCGFENRYGCTWFYNKLKFTYEKNELSQFVRFHYSGKVAYLEYVHQLQNLYHALTGQEITITL